MDYQNVNNYLRRQVKCSHYNSNGGTIFECDTICDLITEAFDNGIAIDKIALLNYICYQFRFNEWQRSIHCCLVKNNIKIANMLSMAFEKIPLLFKMFTEERIEISEMLRYPAYDACYSHANISSACVLTENIANKFIGRLSSNYNQNSDNMELAKFLIQNVKEIENFPLITLCKCKNRMVANYVANIIDKDNFDKEWGKEIMIEAIKNLPWTNCIVSSLVARGVIIEDKHFELVIAHGEAESIGFILSLIKNRRDFVIKREHYKLLLTSGKLMDFNVDKYRIIMEKDKVYKLNTLFEIYLKKPNSIYNLDKMQVLLNFGYKIDEEDALFSVKMKKELPNIETLGIVLDDKFLKACQDNGFFPKYKFTCISAELYELQTLCSIKCLPKIRAFLKRHPNLIPDNICMESACALGKNKVIVEFLIEKGGVVTAKCLKNYAIAENHTYLGELMENFSNKHNIVLK